MDIRNLESQPQLPAKVGSRPWAVEEREICGSDHVIMDLADT